MFVAASSITLSDNFTSILKLPTHCNFFKFILIEEVLQEDYLLIPYGKCRVIGKLLSESDGSVFLQNVRIKNFPDKYSLPEGTLKLRLHNFNVVYPNNSTVEVLGEVFLKIDQEKKKYPAQLTSREIGKQLMTVRKAEDRNNLKIKFKTYYTPTLCAWFVFPVDSGSSLISRNLETRLVRMEIQTDLKRV